MRELNLLPPTRRRQLSRQLAMNSVVRFLRGIIVGLLIVSVVGVGAAVTFQLLGLFLSSATTAELGVQVKRYQELRTQIARENESLEFMAKVSRDRVLWSELFADLYATMPPGTQINAMTADLIPQPKISFSGVAVSRSSLVVLEERLRALPWVAEVKAPSSNLLQRNNPAYLFDVFLKSEESSKKK